MGEVWHIIKSMIENESRLGLQLLSLAMLAVVGALGISIRMNQKLWNRNQEQKDRTNEEMHAAHTASIKALQAADAALIQSIAELRASVPARAEIRELLKTEHEDMMSMFKDLKDTLLVVNNTMAKIQEELTKKVDMTTCWKLQEIGKHG
jgi:hypothetical protein